MVTTEEESVPLAQGIPQVEESSIETVEFVWGGERHVVTMRPSNWGRSKETQRGLKVREYDEELEDGMIRTVREHDAYALALQAEPIFRSRVLTVNGATWSRSYSVDALPDTWVAAFMQELAALISPERALRGARKKSLPR